MAKFHVIAVRDVVANNYSQPFLVSSLGIALRDFADEVNRADEKNHLYRHPNDYELYCLGLFDNETGLYDLKRLPEQISSGSAVKIAVN